MKKSSLFLFIANSLQVIGSVIIFGFLARTVNPEIYGRFRETFILFDVFSGFIGFGSVQAMYFFWNKQSSKLLLNSLFSIIFTLTIGLLVITFISNILFNVSNEYLFLGVMLGLVNNLVILHNNLLVIREKLRLLIITNLCWLSISFFLFYFLVESSTPVNHLTLAISRIIPSFILLIVLFMLNIKIWSDLRFFFNKTLVNYMYPLGISILVGGASYNVDRIIISLKENSEIYGYYINGAFEIPFVGVFIVSVSTILMKDLNLKQNNIDKNSALDSIVNILKLTYPLMIFLTAFCILYADDVMTLVFGPVGLKSSKFFMGYSILYIGRVITYNNVLISFDKNKLILKRSFIELALNVVISLTIYEFFGPFSVVIGTLCSILLFTVPYNWFQIKKVLSVSLFEIIPLKQILMAFLVVIIFWLIKSTIGFSFWLACILLMISFIYTLKIRYIK